MSSKPNRMVFDLEIAQPIVEKNGRPQWNLAYKSGISVLCGWPTAGIFPYVWLLDNCRLPRVFISEDHAASCFGDTDGVVSWNGVGFDNPVMNKCAPDVYKAYKSKKHVDLMAICALLQAGVSESKLEDGVPDNWQNLASALNGGFLNKGWGLEAVAQGTLGNKVGKMEGMGGAKAPKAWQQGRYSEVTSYCIGDVALTKLLYEHAWEHGWLESSERGRVAIDRCLL